MSVEGPTHIPQHSERSPARAVHLCFYYINTCCYFRSSCLCFPVLVYCLSPLGNTNTPQQPPRLPCSPLPPAVPGKKRIPARRWRRAEPFYAPSPSADGQTEAGPECLAVKVPRRPAPPRPHRDALRARVSAAPRFCSGRVCVSRRDRSVRGKAAVLSPRSPGSPVREQRPAHAYTTRAG